MAFDLQSIETRIRKLQKLRDLLSDEETRELMSDPEVLAALRETVNSANGANKNAAKAAHEAGSLFTDEVEAETKLPAEGTLRRAVFDVVMTFTGRFFARNVLEKLEESGYQFEASDHMIAVNTALRGLQHKKLVRLVAKGSGRKGNKYEVSKGVSVNS